jgi:Mor family transcriptional regulator
MQALPADDLQTAVELLAREDSRAWMRGVSDFVDLIEDEMHQAAFPMDATQRRRLSWRLVARIIRDVGGMSLYIPKYDALRRAVRDRRIQDEYDGTVNGPRGAQALAAETGLTCKQIYYILRKRRNRRFAARPT